MSTDEDALAFHFNICITALNFAKVDDKMNQTERTHFSIINYKLRAEILGKFHVMPHKTYAMYAPEVKAISDEMRVQVTD
jgi:hypothetical protein